MTNSVTPNAVFSRRRVGLLFALSLVLGARAETAQAQPFEPVKPTAGTIVMWINPLEMLAGDPSVRTSFNAINSGVGTGLSGLVIESTTVGDVAEAGGNKVVEVGLQVPPDYRIKGVRVCYESSNSRSFITQIRLSQLQNPPSSAIVRLDDGTDLTNEGPICTDSQSATVDPADGAIFLSLRLNFSSAADRIVIRALGLHLEKK